MTIHLSSRVLTAVVAGFALVAVAVLFWFLRPPAYPDRRPITMAATFLGLQVSTYNDGAVPETMTWLKQELNGAQLGFATYGEPGGTMVNVLAARTDLTGQVDLRMVNDNGRPYGKSRCTRNLSLRTAEEDADDPGTPFPGRMTCWRTSERLSVSAFALTPPESEQELAQAVDALWESLR